MRQTVGKIDDTLRLEHKKASELTDESVISYLFYCEILVSYVNIGTYNS